MASCKAARAEELKEALEKHETETEEHIARLEKVFEEIDETPRGKTSDANHGHHRGRSGRDEGIQRCAGPELLTGAGLLKTLWLMPSPARRGPWVDPSNRRCLGFPLGLIDI
jgi:hypothetical protein